jgi:hypothetical protein
MKQRTYRRTDTEHSPTSNRDFPNDEALHPPHFTVNAKTAADRQTVDTEKICESSRRDAERQYRVSESFPTS